MSTIDVSIIVPVYNVENYVLECLNSISGQFFSGTIECILVDDCGQDHSVEIVENYIKEYKGPIQFSFLHHDCNKGLSAARNTGTRASNGEYVFFLDSDDYLYPHSIYHLYNVAKKYPKAEIVQGSTPPLFQLSRERMPDYTEDVDWIRKGFSTFSIYDPAWNRLVKRQFIIDNNLFFVEGYLQEDTIWSFQLQRSVRKMAFCFETTYYYRYNPNGIMHGASVEKEARSFARVFNYIFNAIIHSDKIEPYEIEYLEKNALRIMHSLGFEEGNKLLSTQNNPIFNKLLKESKKVSRRGIKKPFKLFFLRCICYLYYNSKLSKLRSRLCDINTLMINYTPFDN